MHAITVDFEWIVVKSNYFFLRRLTIPVSLFSLTSIASKSEKIYLIYPIPAKVLESYKLKEIRGDF